GGTRAPGGICSGVNPALGSSCGVLGRYSFGRSIWTSGDAGVAGAGPPSRPAAAPANSPSAAVRSVPYLRKRGVSSCDFKPGPPCETRQKTFGGARLYGQENRPTNAPRPGLRLPTPEFSPRGGRLSIPRRSRPRGRAPPEPGNSRTDGDAARAAQVAARGG